MGDGLMDIVWDCCKIYYLMNQYELEKKSWKILKLVFSDMVHVLIRY